MRSIYLSCALLALSAVPGFCTSVFYADRTSWLNAVASPSTVDFENAVGNYSTAAGFTTGLLLPDNPAFVGMVVVNGSAGYNLLIQDPTVSQYYNFGSGASLWWSNLGGLTTSSVLRVTWPSPVKAVGLDIMTYGDSGVSYSVKVNNDASIVYTTGPTQAWSASPTRTFFGFTSDMAISSIDISLPLSSSGTPVIDNFSFATSLAGTTGPPADPTDTPELCTFLLIASGLIGMALMGKRFCGVPALPDRA